MSHRSIGETATMDCTAADEDESSAGRYVHAINTQWWISTNLGQPIIICHVSEPPASLPATIPCNVAGHIPQAVVDEQSVAVYKPQQSVFAGHM
jgi:hypothetical protein